MAVQTELVLAQFSSLKTTTKAENDQKYWFQTICSQLPKPILHVKPEFSYTTPSQTLEPLAHESRVQWFACQLSKDTLRQYLNFIRVPLPLQRGSSSLDILPQDIIDRICRYIPYENLLWLYQESKSLHRIIDPHLAPHETKLSLVLRAERDYPKHYDPPARRLPGLGCFMCYRVLPVSVFAKHQTRQALLRTLPSEEQSVIHLRRFCIPCGIQSGCHVAGDELNTRTGERYWLCDCLCVLSDATPGCGNCSALCPLAPKGSRERMSPRRAEKWHKD
ncbi:hypothetical protein GGS26DRAFT_105690 [Hypomontagnella submonticulosa]|nr:hypothetical protein GGS26DRAFT_105690 [Hypomontagnella submonticulosa]